MHKGLKVYFIELICEQTVGAVICAKFFTGIYYQVDFVFERGSCCKLKQRWLICVAAIQSEDVIGCYPQKTGRCVYAYK
jgi:hypothetical protein